MIKHPLPLKNRRNTAGASIPPSVVEAHPPLTPPNPLMVHMHYTYHK